MVCCRRSSSEWKASVAAHFRQCKDDDDQFEDSNAATMSASEKQSITTNFERTVLGVLMVFQGSLFERIMALWKQMKLHIGKIG